jgi:hypothetical protein
MATRQEQVLGQQRGAVAAGAVAEDGADDGRGGAEGESLCEGGTQGRRRRRLRVRSWRQGRWLIIQTGGGRGSVVPSRPSTINATISAAQPTPYSRGLA